MNKFKIFSIIIIGLSLAIFTGCDKNEPADEPSMDGLVFNGNEIGNGDQDFEVNQHFTLKRGVYILKGWVYINDGASVSIPAGTVIKGDKETKAAFIVRKGGQLIAQGTATEPIIFTSNQPKGQRKPGDWGGIIICGRARNNQGTMEIEGGPDAPHGGADDNDNSGVLSYVRCEFAGFPFATDQEINGITFGSVGRGTKIDHVQVSYSNDDSFEWFGGSVDAKYLIAYHGWDDDFDTDNGFSGRLQFLLAVKNPRIADQSVSNGFESDNNANGTEQQPFTSAVFSNVTIAGPMAQANDFANTTDYINGGGYNPQNGSRLGVFQTAMHIRRNSKLNCFNSVAVGFPVGLLLDNEKGTTQTWATQGQLKLQNLYFAGMIVLGSDRNKSFKDLLSTDGKTDTEGAPSFSSTFFNAQSSNRYYENAADLHLNSSWKPAAGSPLTAKSGLFTDNALASGFEQVDYIGAFANENDSWASGWTNFDPQNTEY
ncbi:MAG: hypothetical protein LBS01_10940 [Prevotellaceae bacterium]|jgi:hypothetical protein|nr:hypothetical protein [Prevotellaceae bacterium]